MAGGDRFESRPEPNVGVDAVQFRRLDRLVDPSLYWDRVRERAVRQDVRIHDLRHSFASRPLALGESLPMIGKLLGHTQIQTTARYAHVANGSVKASGARVGDSIATHIKPVVP